MGNPLWCIGQTIGFNTILTREMHSRAAELLKLIDTDRMKKYPNIDVAKFIYHVYRYDLMNWDYTADSSMIYDADPIIYDFIYSKEKIVTFNNGYDQYGMGVVDFSDHKFHLIEKYDLVLRPGNDRYTFTLGTIKLLCDMCVKLGRNIIME
jgi:hypothetical protein